MTSGPSTCGRARVWPTAPLKSDASSVARSNPTRFGTVPSDATGMPITEAPAGMSVSTRIAGVAARQDGTGSNVRAMASAPT